MNNKCLPSKQEFLLDNQEIGAQIGVKIQRENGFQFRKIRAAELTYDPIGFRERD